MKLLLLLSAAALLTSCATPEQVQARQEALTDSHSTVQQKRSARQQGRDERYQNSWDRAMHRAPGETGIKMY